MNKPALVTLVISIIIYAVSAILASRPYNLNSYDVVAAIVWSLSFLVFLSFFIQKESVGKIVLKVIGGNLVYFLLGGLLLGIGIRAAGGGEAGLLIFSIFPASLGMLLVSLIIVLIKCWLLKPNT